jgi:lipopolysaccharide export LptBFGC system permease protein LptF
MVSDLRAASATRETEGAMQALSSSDHQWLMDQLTPTERKRVTRAAWGRGSITDPRLAALTAEHARRQSRPFSVFLLSAVTLLFGPVSRVLSGRVAFGTPIADVVLIVLFSALFLWCLAGLWFATRARRRYANDEGHELLRRACAQRPTVPPSHHRVEGG